MNIVSTEAFLAARSVRNVSARARVPDEVPAVAAEDGLLEEALDEPVLVHPSNGPSSARFDGRGRSFDTLNFLSQRGQHFNFLWTKASIFPK